MISTEQMAQQLYESATGTHEEKRVQVARAFGYVDARLAARLYQEHGLHPVDLAIHARKQHGLDMDWSALERELQANGTKPETAKALIAEASYFERFDEGAIQ